MSSTLENVNVSVSLSHHDTIINHITKEIDEIYHFISANAGHLTELELAMQWQTIENLQNQRREQREIIKAIATPEGAR